MIRCILFLFLTLLVACQESNPPTTQPTTTSILGQAMTMPYRILIGQSLSWKEKVKVKKMIAQTFDEIDHIYNKWNPGSELSKLNRAKAYEKIALSKELESFLLRTGSFVALTGGKFDPTIEAAQKVWKRALENGKVPKESEILELKGAVGWERIHIEKGIFWKEHDRLELDLGGIAKGYAIDLLMERFIDAGYPNVYVEWGGEIRTAGQHPDQRPWRIFISKDGSHNPDLALAFVELKNQAVASSGDYFQNWTINGITYFHIFDPKTLKPLVAKQNAVSSATVVANDCMTADVLATTAMLFASDEEAVMGLNEVKNEMEGLKFWFAFR